MASGAHTNAHTNGFVHSGEVDPAENFTGFFQSWLGVQERDLHALIAAAGRREPAEDRRLRQLIDRVVGHYENYYSAKSSSAKRDVLPMFTPPWTSSTENLFLWVGGWRPSMAFHLLYSKAGLQLESQLPQLVRGEHTGDLADLSPDQLRLIDELQRQTIKLEKEISEEEAQAQETVADTQLVDLSHVITEMKMKEREDGRFAAGEEMMEPAMKERRETMKKVLEKADRLRLDTIRRILELLRPAQAVHFLIAAAELHLRVHEFGKRKDETAAAAAAEGDTR